MNSCVHHILTEPWPQIGPQQPNPALVRALFPSYAGARGELTAITGYFYNSLLTGGRGDRGLSELFACVSRDEMRHLEKLGGLILQFGGDPRLLSYGANGRPLWWSSGVLSYPREIPLMLRQAIDSERQAIAEYRRLSACMDGAPRALIERIIRDEEHHIELFQCAQNTAPQPENFRGRA